MPELHFRVRWPDGERSTCYSPSSTTRDHFDIGVPYPLDEFVARSRRALKQASERVAARYGYACSSAAAQLDEIERHAARFADPSASVTVEAFEDPS